MRLLSRASGKLQPKCIERGCDRGLGKPIIGRVIEGAARAQSLRRVRVSRDQVEVGVVQLIADGEQVDVLCAEHGFLKLHQLPEERPELAPFVRGQVIYAAHVTPGGHDDPARDWAPAVQPVDDEAFGSRHDAAP